MSVNTPALEINLQILVVNKAIYKDFVKRYIDLLTKPKPFNYSS